MINAVRAAENKPALVWTSPLIDRPTIEVKLKNKNAQI